MSNQQPPQVRVSGMDIPFNDLVVFLIKLAIAAIPAILIVAVIFTVASAFIGGVLFKASQSKESAETIMVIGVILLGLVFVVSAFRKSK